MKILDMLYDGRIYPAETVKPATEKYRQEGVRFGVGLMRELGEMDRQDK